MILASGEVVHASAESHPDLWRSLQGSLNNFGIVTSVKMRTFQAEDIWGGGVYYMLDAFAQLMQQACDFAYHETDPDSHIMASAGYGFGHQVVTCVMDHTKGMENPPALQRFTNWSRKSRRWGFCG